DHVFQPGLVSQVEGIGLDIGQAAEKRQSLAPEYHQIDCDVLLVKLLHLIDNLAKQVDIETAAQATISGNDNDANSLGLTLDHERVLKIRVRLRQVADCPPNLLRIGTCRFDPFLGSSHLGCS